MHTTVTRFSRLAPIAVALVIAVLAAGAWQARPAAASHVNSGFETGDLSGWTADPVTEGVFVVGNDPISADISQAPLEGSQMARLGVPEPSDSENQPEGLNVLSQTFVIDESSVKFGYNVWTYDYTGFDEFSVELRITGSNTVIYSHYQQAWGASHDTARKNSGWQIVNIPTNAYVGQEATLTFRAGGSHDNLYAFWVYIDSAENVTPPQVVDMGQLTINGNSVSHDPASGIALFTARPSSGSIHIEVPVTCPDGSDPNMVTAIIGSSPPTSASLFKQGSTNIWKGDVPIPFGATSGQTFAVTLVVDCGGVQITVLVGQLTLVDPSGFITDASSGAAIVGATVTLQRLAGDTWETVNPYATDAQGNAQIQPQVNPQITDGEGHYAWDVAAGTYRVSVEAAGYQSQTSPEVTVPPPVTDLNLQLVAGGGGLISGDVNCNGTVDTLDSLAILRYVAGMSTPDCLAAADVNWDQDANSVDALFILRYVAQLPYTIPAGFPDIGEPIVTG